MKKIVNLTQHRATPEQVAQGVVDLPEEDMKVIHDLLTFDEIPNIDEMLYRSQKIADVANDNDATHAMCGGAPFFMSYLERELYFMGINPLYAFSKRESSEIVHPDGTVTKLNVFKHLGFVGDIS